MDKAERIKKYTAYLAEEKANKLAESKNLITAFITYCKTHNVELELSDFDYQQTVGIICNSKDIVFKISQNLNADKEGLFDFRLLLKAFSTKPFSEGALFAGNYMVFASSYYRRGYYENNNYAPRFIDHFWKHDFQKNEIAIALDLDRVRIDTDGPVLIEEDTWYGGKFNQNISEIKDGVTNLRPPQYLNEFELDFIFAKAYALDVYWIGRSK